MFSGGRESVRWEQMSQLKFLGNKAKGQISKRVFQENRAYQIF